ncbi:MAG TPA: hypothetical protein VMK12_03185 [Anaeromyxobacteraceae bacterium]|nr:hypothetical protein [Anaeromyxobacteraceae bacterium]
MVPDRWENGSTYQWLGVPEAVAPQLVPWRSGLLLLSGRDALRLVLDLGVRERGWRRLWVPEYFCQDVVAALMHPGLLLRPYPDHPLRAEPDLPDARPGDAILLVNYFGLRGPLAFSRREGVEMVEDHTHDPYGPWPISSAADFCVISLRKTLPVSDGGAVWSPRGHDLPAALPLDAMRARSAATKLAAMILKALYLEGHPVKKDAYRVLEMAAEQDLGIPGISAMSEVSAALVDAWPAERWRRERLLNWERLRQLLADVPGVRILAPLAEGAVPFACVVAVDSAQRSEHVRRRLIEHRVYPAVHWPLERTVLQVSDEARELSRRLFTIHCDGRYGCEDLARVAELLASATRVA